MKRSTALVRIAVVLHDNPDTRHWGWTLSRTAGVRSGKLYPLLTQMLERGWLTDGWETPEEHGPHRSARRYYQVTAAGRQAFWNIINERQPA